MKKLLLLFVVASTVIYAQDLKIVQKQVSEILKALEGKYSDSVDSEQILHDITASLATNLQDEHLAYISENELQILQKGKLQGIGAAIEHKDGIFTITHLIRGAPAYTSGLKPSDQITAVDKQSASNMSLKDLVYKLRGEQGTSVQVTVYRPLTKSTLDINIIREEFQLNNYQYKTISHDSSLVGYLNISYFSKGLVKDVQQHFQNGDSSCLIIDLRECSGGLLDESIKLADSFLKQGTIVQIKKQDGANKLPLELVPSTPKTFFDGGVVLLTSHKSISAAEIFTAALQENNRAIVIGETTKGKGSIQSLAELPSGGAVKFTIGSYLTPRGNVVEGVGVAPNIEWKSDTIDLKKVASLVITITKMNSGK